MSVADRSGKGWTQQLAPVKACLLDLRVSSDSLVSRLHRHETSCFIEYVEPRQEYVHCSLLLAQKSLILIYHYRRADIDADFVQQALQQNPLQYQQQQQLLGKQAGHEEGAQAEAVSMQRAPLMQQIQSEKLVRLERAVSTLQRELGLSRQREEKAEVLQLLIPTLPGSCGKELYLSSCSLH